MQFPIFIELRRSFICTFVVCCMHGVAALCLMAAPFDWPWRLFLLLPISGSLRFSLRPQRFRLLSLLVGGRLHVTGVDGGRMDARVLPDSAVFTWLVVLRFVVAGEHKPQTLTLFPDQMSRDDFRELCLCLRWNLTAGVRDEPGF